MMRPRYWIGLFLCALSAAGFILSGLPVTRSQSQFDIEGSAYVDVDGEQAATFPTGTDGRVALPASYTITLDLPASLRSGEEEALRLAIQPHEPMNDSSPLAGWQVSAEANLASPELDVAPQGNVYLAFDPDRAAEFHWYLRGKQGRAAVGTLWLNLLYLPPQGGDPVRVLILARPLDFAISTILGIQPGYLRIAALITLLAGIWLLLPQAVHIFTKQWRGLRGVDLY